MNQKIILKSRFRKKSSQLLHFKSVCKVRLHMEGDQNLIAIKEEPVEINEEIKSETKDELLVGITAQNIPSGQEFEDTTGPISGAVVKTEPTEIKSEPEDEPLLVEIAAQDVVDGQKFKEESDNEAQTQGRPKEPKIEADNQSVFYGLDDNKRLVMKYTLGESQSAESESVVMSPLYKSIKMTIIEDKDEPEFINITPLSTFRCLKCSYQTQNRDTLIVHKRTHKKENKKHKCNQCDYRTYKLALLRSHNLSHLQPEEIQYFYCYHCDFKAKWISNLKVHIKRHYEREEVEFECHICDFKTKTRQIYSYHIEEHTPVAQLKTLNCPECDFTTKFLGDLNEHKYKCHGESYQCPKCPYQTNTQATLNTHKRTHKTLQKKDKKYKCNKCDYRTFKISNLKEHSINHLKPEEIQYFYCYHCNFKTKWKNCLKTHIERHYKREEVQFKCHICDFSTKKRQIYSHHIDGECNKKQIS